jgi:hypothetical protein
VLYEPVLSWAPYVSEYRIDYPDWPRRFRLVTSFRKRSSVTY